MALQVQWLLSMVFRIIIMRDSKTGNSIVHESFELSDQAVKAMNNQHFCNHPIIVSYAYKKGTKGDTMAHQQTQLEEERRKRQETEARMIAEREVEREARLADQQRMSEMFQYMQSLGTIWGGIQQPHRSPNPSPHQSSRPPR
eukprot:XP_008653959.1 uncharacterized protein LOC103634133 [Zea mays]